MNVNRKIATFTFNAVVKPLVRLSLLTWVVLALTICVVFGTAADSEGLFLLGVLGFVGLPFVLGAVAAILLPFTR